MDRPLLPRTIIGYVIRNSGVHQLGLATLSAAVFGLSAVPLELQRRIVNDAIKSGATRTILWLAAAYAGPQTAFALDFREINPARGDLSRPIQVMHDPLVIPLFLRLDLEAHEVSRRPGVYL